MKLTAKLIRDILRDCIVTDPMRIDQFSHIDVYQDSVINGTHLVSGVTCYPYFFDEDKLKAHEDEIMAALKELPGYFMQSAGTGGWSFLNCCIDRYGHQWGEQEDADMLIALGRAIGKAIWVLPETHWCVLPGSMPYIMILDGPPPEKPGSKKTNPVIESVRGFIDSIGLLLFCT